MNKNKKVLNDFVSYCTLHPELRFWQALMAWAGKQITIGLDEDGDTSKDPYYFKNKDN